MFNYDSSVSRPYTCRLLEEVDEGIIDAKVALQAALCYMSEDEVKDMCFVNEFIGRDDEDDDFEDDYEPDHPED